MKIWAFYDKQITVYLMAHIDKFCLVSERVEWRRYKKIRAFMAHMKLLSSYEKNFLVTGRCFNIV